MAHWRPGIHRAITRLAAFGLLLTLFAAGVPAAAQQPAPKDVILVHGLFSDPDDAPSAAAQQPAPKDVILVHGLFSDPDDAPSAAAQQPAPKDVILVHGLFSDPDDAPSAAAQQPAPKDVILVHGLFSDPDDAPSAAAQQPAPKDVILVHGLFSDPDDAWKEMKERLADEGIYAWTIDFASDPITNSNEAPVALQAQALSVYIKKVLATSGHDRVSLVCHSMGGLAARYYLQHDTLWPTPKSPQVVSLIMLGTPNWGTDAFLQDPVIAVIAARASGTHGLHNVDRLDSWSEALKDMFAEWQPAPRTNDQGAASYPARFRLGEWRAAAGSTDYISPMSEGKLRNGNVWKVTRFLTDMHVIVSDADDRSAVTEAIGRFSNSSKRSSIHRDYYLNTSRSLGVLYPIGAPPESWGVSARYVSHFLADLNVPGADRSGARIYLIAGSRPDVRIDEIRTHLSAPFTALSSDGLVAIDSVLGVDPITGVSVFSNVKGQRILNVNHSDLPHSKAAIDIVVDWLKDN